MSGLTLPAAGLCSAEWRPHVAWWRGTREGSRAATAVARSGIEQAADRLRPAALAAPCRHQSPSVLVPALRTVGNIVTGDDMQTQVRLGAPVQ